MKINGLHDANANHNCLGLIGDLNDDDGLNIMDVVVLADCILTANCGELSNGCNGDLNGDNGWNVIDIIALVNCILNENCT